MSADATGLIDPSLFPFPSATIDVSGLERAADGLVRLGSRVSSATDDIGTEWDRLPAGYQAPEQEQVYALMAPVVASGEEVDGDVVAAARKLTEYAQALAAIKPRMRDLEERAQRFRDAVELGVKAEVAESASWQGALATAMNLARIPREREWVIIPWDQDSGTAARNADLLAEHARLIEEITTASAECCNGIVGLVPGYRGDEFVPVYAEQFLDPGNPMVWGSPGSGDQNVIEAAANRWHAIGSNVVTGAASMLGFDPSNDWRHDREFWWQQVGGAVDAVGSMAITGVTYTLAVANPGLLASLHQAASPEQEQWLAERYEVGYTNQLAAVGIDWQAHIDGRDGLWQWKEDWAGTLTETSFNVLSSVAGAGVGGASVRIGLLGRLGRLGSGAVDWAVGAVSVGVRVGGSTWRTVRQALRTELPDVDRPGLPEVDSAGSQGLALRPDIDADLDGGSGRPGDLTDGRGPDGGDLDGDQRTDGATGSEADAGADGGETGGRDIVDRTEVADGSAPTTPPDTATGAVVDRTLYATDVAQTQGRHVLGSPTHKRDSGYFLDAADAQSVLDAFHDGSATILGFKPNGDVVVRVEGISGYNTNVGAGFVDQPTNVFFIKGTMHPSVVPYNPSWTPPTSRLRMEAT